MPRPPLARLAAALALLPIALLRAQAEPTVKEIITYYDVSGTTAAELRTNLNSVRPTSKKDGHGYDGITRWFVNWRYTYRNGTLGCTIASVSSTIEVAITMPRLATNASVPAPLASAFTEYTEKLLLHERGHGQNGIDTARRIEDGIRVLPPQRTCGELGRAANALGDSLIKEGSRLDVEYDARTQHGRTQGAHFP